MRQPNFSPGPSALPECVLEQIRHELLDFQGTGKSILETSHRSAEFELVLDEANRLLRGLLGLDDRDAVIWLQGGASQQFAQLPMNRLQPGATAAFVDTGVWSKKAMAAASTFGRVHRVASSADTDYDRIPNPDTWSIPDDAAYLHITSNNTIFGTQFAGLGAEYVPSGGLPLVCDVSSDFLSRPMDVGRFRMMYAGAQKNLGPAGVTLVVGDRDWLTAVREDTPEIWRYETHVQSNSLYHTPPTFSIYVCSLVLRWLTSLGGLEAMAERNAAKASAVYEVIDDHPDFYVGRAQPNSRSEMNVTFRLSSEAHEADFLRRAALEGLVGLRGHRSAGGIRASLYNGVQWEWVEHLVDFMRRFPMEASHPARA